MSTQIKNVTNFQVPTAVGIALSVGTNQNAVIQALAFTSQEATNVQLMTLYVVPPAGTPGATNTILYQKAVPPGPITSVSELVNLIIPAGYTLQALAGAGTVTYMNASFLLVSVN